MKELNNKFLQQMYNGSSRSVKASLRRCDNEFFSRPLHQRESKLMVINSSNNKVKYCDGKKIDMFTHAIQIALNWADVGYKGIKVVGCDTQEIKAEFRANGSYNLVYGKYLEV